MPKGVPKPKMTLKVASITTKEVERQEDDEEGIKRIVTLAASAVTVPEGTKTITLTTNAKNRAALKDLFGFAPKPGDGIILTIEKTNIQQTLEGDK